MINKYSILLCIALVFSSGCAQHINANVSASVEDGYKATGQSVSIGALPSINKAEYLSPEIIAQTSQALQELGYNIGTKPADVHVRIYWKSFGPYITYSENPLWDFDTRGRGPWRKPRFVKEEKYLRVLILEAWANRLAEGEQANEAGLAPFLQVPLSYKQAVSYLPKPPARLLWRVEAQSVGNLSSVEKVLPELMQAALPWMARSVDVRVVVQGEEAKEIVTKDSIIPAEHNLLY